MQRARPVRAVFPALALVLVLAACATAPRRGEVLPGGDGEAFWTAGERARIDGAADLDVVTRGSPEAAVLRRRAREVPAGLDVRPVLARMQAAMERTGGVGIAAPQVGLSARMAVLKLDYRTDHPFVVRVRNPGIVERSDEVRDSWEGCLSVPDVGGLVRRNRAITVEWVDADTGEARRERFEDANAILWQHEIDHLDGVLYVDRRLGDLVPMEEARRQRKALEERLQRERGR